MSIAATIDNAVKRGNEILDGVFDFASKNKGRRRVVAAFIVTDIIGILVDAIKNPGAFVILAFGSILIVYASEKFKTRGE